MKNNKSKGKSQQDQSGQGSSDSNLPPFQKDEDDVDFEILDALEQIEQAGKVSQESSFGEESSIELSLEGEELTFGEGEIEEESGIRALDMAAIRAIQSSAPFAPLPDGYEEEYLVIHLRFEHKK